MAAEQEKSGGLQVEEDRPWQEKIWTAQRVAWVVMALIIVAAIAGLTGKGGPLASASARVPGAVIEYPRITRWQSQEQVTVRLAPSASGRVDVQFSPAFIRLFRIESIEPEPDSVQATGNGHRFTFDVGGGGASDKLIEFNVATGKPVIAQPMQARIGTASADMSVTVLP